jgi:hypothetical protein
VADGLSVIISDAQLRELADLVAERVASRLGVDELERRRWLDIRDAAAYLHLHPDTLRKRVRQGLVPCEQRAKDDGAAAPRTCVVRGNSIAGRRSDAVSCGGGCRAAPSRRTQQRPARQFWTAYSAIRRRRRTHRRTQKSVYGQTPGLRLVPGSSPSRPARLARKPRGPVLRRQEGADL